MLKNPFIIPGIRNVKIESQLNANYNFDNFLEGDSNRLARSAGMAVANKPGGTSFNPLLIYGGVGLGKTWMDSQFWMTSNASIGMNYWFNDVWGLTAQVDYKLNLSENGRGNTPLAISPGTTGELYPIIDEGGSMRYSVGFSVKFGGIDTDGAVSYTHLRAHET